MAYCSKCGLEIEEKTAVCPHCGEQQQVKAPVTDNGGFLWALLGFCIPVVGLILFLVWKGDKPKTAKAAGVGALVSVILSVVFYVISAALGIGAALMGM